MLPVAQKKKNAPSVFERIKKTQLLVLIKSKFVSF